MDENKKDNFEQLKIDCGFYKTKEIPSTTHTGVTKYSVAKDYPEESLSKYLQLKQVATLIKIKKWITFFGIINIAGLTALAVYLLISFS